MKKLLQSLLVISVMALLIGCVKQPVEKDPVFDHIELKTAPTKVSYVEGETFDPTGIVVEGVSLKEDGSEVRSDVTSSVSYDKTVLELGDTKVVVNYIHETVNYHVDVPITVTPIRELAGSYPKVSYPTTGLEISTPSSKGVANSRWELNYSETSLEIEVVVKDYSITSPANIFQGDAIEVTLSKVTRQTGITDGTLLIAVGALGNSIIKKYDAGVANDYSDEGIVITNTKITIDGKYVDGYKTTITIPLTILSIEANAKDVLVLPGLYNSVGSSANVKFVEGFNTDANEVHTYPHLSDSNTLVDNPWYQIGAVFGDTGTLTHKGNWDLSGDDGSEDSTVNLLGITEDNNLYMYRNTSTNLLAYASLNAKSVLNNEKYGKFGFSVTTLDGQKGFLFFVDAAGSGTNMTGNRVGVTNRNNGSWVWPEAILSTLSDAQSYQGDNYIELKLYREGDIFKFYVNGIEVGIKGPFPGIGSDTEAVVQLVSFNILIQAKDYGVTSDAEVLEDYKIVTEDLDYLFIGDSYIDKAFWQTFNLSFPNDKGYTSANMGVGGTRTAYWTNLAPTISTLYAPLNIIVHIGVNDVNDGGSNGTETLALVTQLFDVLANRFPNANLYYISIEPNNFRPLSYPDYKIVNQGIEALDGVTLINTAEALLDEAGVNVARYFGVDGLHLNSDGYAIFEKTIYEALDLERPSDDTTNLGDYGIYARSAGWVYSEDVVENIGVGEQQVYFVGGRGFDFAVSVDVNVGANTATDSFPKVGFSVKSAYKTALFFIDVTANRSNNWGNYVVRNSGADWDWGPTNIRPYIFLGDTNYGTGFKTIQLIKIGTSLYFISDNKVVQYAENIFASEEEVQVGIITFNLNVKLKNAEVYEDDSFTSKLAEFKIAAKTGSLIDGSISDWTESQKTNPLYIPASDSKSVLVYAYMAVEGIYIAYEANHGKFINDKPNWFDNTNVEFRLQDGNIRAASASGWYSRWETGGSRDIGVSKFVTTKPDALYHTVAELFIPWAMIDGYSYANDYVLAGFAFKTPGDERTAWAGGDFWFSPEADPGLRTQPITKDGFQAGSDLTIDGSLDDWSEEVLLRKRSSTNAGRQFEIASFVGSDGLYTYVKVTTPNQITTALNSLDWFLNPNVEFWIFDQQCRIMVFNNHIAHTGKVTNAAYTYDSETHTIIFEFFVSFVNFSSQSKTDVVLRVGTNSIDGGWHMPLDSNVIVTKDGLPE